MPRLRPAARALVLDDSGRILLCRFTFDKPDAPVEVWATPGGGVEPGESALDALRRELVEEIGLALDADPPHVWHQEVVAAGHATGYDGVINDYFLVHTGQFEPRGSMTEAELAAENVTEFRWWTRAELDGYRGPGVFSPRALPDALAALLADGPPAEPIAMGL
ncbi:DNA mismatch repair protein MutT [Longispora fulva]|uniref:ADP-ribose pyrophosphatase YjhB (NUDIX family) n=1 Tax=Longispora fulva TaxID=619741 RepID=A0A8J7KJL1_9ACTN|nr:NUDIX domain-containing protein [Longispora fulva]MBG6135576.1 ADP-ribose pyrophosphatase YjhB (NUDIX family) [Longispora fulva]GIG56185.1 DNA mismatch repair protein MutT [Longispora fulva]